MTEHGASEVEQARPVSIIGFDIDHGEGAHAGNAPEWRTTVIARVRLDYLGGKPTTLVRLEGETATELLAQLAEAVAIRGRVSGEGSTD